MPRKAFRVLSQSRHQADLVESGGTKAVHQTADLGNSRLGVAAELVQQLARAAVVDRSTYGAEL